MRLLSVYALFCILAAISTQFIPSIVDNIDIRAQLESDAAPRIKRQFGYGGYGGGWGGRWGRRWGRRWGGGWGRRWGGGWGRRWGGGWGGRWY